MIPEIGHFALIIALLVSLVLGILPLVGAHRGVAAWVALARPAASAQFLFIGISFACLMAAFIGNDFTVLYVAEQSNSMLPLLYRISGVWGGHEGSLLLWVMMLSTWTLAVAAFSRTLPEDMVARVLGVLGLVSSGFLLFILTTSNPFQRLLPGAEDGRDLNPLLQDPGLAFHPPMLYMGYVGFSVAFAFAIAALLSGRLDAAWARCRGRGPSPPGSSSPAASRWVRSGPTTNWAGAAGGSGTRSRTHPSCPGWWAPH
jgi:cytochrome c-type biogenesis protein CcmF